MAAPEPVVRTYGNWHRPTSPGLMGLGPLGTGLLLAGLVAVIVAIVLAGVVAAVAVGAVLLAAVGLLAVRDRHHRTGVQRLGSWATWWWRRRQGDHLYRSGPLGRVPWGTYQLPGLLAASRLSEAQDSYGRPFALLHVPATGHVSVAFATEPDGASLVDQEQVDAWVAHWGGWLATLGDEPGVVAASVVVETAPDSGTRLEREVQTHVDAHAPAVAAEMLREVVATYPQGSATVRAAVTITFAMAPRPGARRRSIDDMGRELASRLPGLGQRLHATGAGAARPMAAQDLCEAVRTAYDPAAARLIDAAHAAGHVPQLRWPDVGPTAAQAGWGHYVHDGAVSVSWTMTAAPRGEVYSSVLTQLLAPHRDVDRKRVALLYRPLDSTTAARIVEADKRAADFRATATRRPTARVVAAQRAATARAQEEARGAGLVNVGVVVTATVTAEERLPAARAAVDNLSATARLQLRPAYGSQDAAFAASLPVGLVLPAHLRVPTEVRELM